MFHTFAHICTRMPWMREAGQLTGVPYFCSYLYPHALGAGGLVYLGLGGLIVPYDVRIHVCDFNPEKPIWQSGVEEQKRTPVTQSAQSSDACPGADLCQPVPVTVRVVPCHKHN